MRLAFAVVLLTLVSGKAQVDSEAKISDLQVRIVDGFGRPISPVDVVVVGIDVRMAKQAEGQTVFRVPYGRYRLDVKAGSLGTATTDVVVQTPAALSVVAVPLRTLDHGEIVRDYLSGRLSERLNGAGVWVRIVSVFSGLSVSVPVSSGGYFLAEGLPPGLYAVLVIRDGRIAATESVAVTANSKPLVIQ